MKRISLLIVGLAATASANTTANTAAYQEVCASPAKALCVIYPAAWKRTSIRTERSKNQEKITALYAYHQINADTGFAEGLEASLSAASAGFDARTALTEDIQARREILSTVTYSASGANWYVISGTDFRGNIFYSKSVGTGAYVKALNILYPPSNKTYWNGILKDITQKFR